MSETTIVRAILVTQAGATLAQSEKLAALAKQTGDDVLRAVLVAMALGYLEASKCYTDTAKEISLP